MSKPAIVNIYNFIRMSHVEPSIFIPDDFETVRNQMTLIRQYGFPATYALKYDALMNSRYQELLKTYADEKDEISAWWEITQPLCRRAGVTFRGAWSEEFDERVNSAYSIGYSPDERRRLVDAYMEDFRQVFGCWPKTIGSWVLDTATVAYAAEQYGILGSAICRDQMGTDGFTLWGGFPNGIYYPSRRNENIPAGTYDGQLKVPMFRLLGPDPIYNFEQDVRPGLHGVYTLEPSWLIGRSPEWISYFFDCLTEEDSLGTGYAQVGQENNFLWENIRPGLAVQLPRLKELLSVGKIRIETMADSAAWFRQTYRLTPPMTFQASKDWDIRRNLSAQWYACSNYRLGFLGEEGCLRIRDFFLYRQDYPSRYLDAPMDNAKSNFDALPVLFPQMWVDQAGRRPYIRLLDEENLEPAGTICYKTLDELRARAELREEGTERALATFTMSPDRILLEGNVRLVFDCLPVFRGCDGRRILLRHEGFSYGFEVEEGQIFRAEKESLEIQPEKGRVCLRLGDAVTKDMIFTGHGEAERGGNAIALGRRTTFPVPPMAPVMEPGSCVFLAGSVAQVRLARAAVAQDGSALEGAGEIRYTLDGAQPGKDSLLYDGPLELRSDAVVRASFFLTDGRCSETVSSEYRFGIPGILLVSDTEFDPRSVFRGNGVMDLLEPRRGSLDYLDGRWRGTLQDLEIRGQLPSRMPVGTITVGFLSHHRAGVIYPQSLQLYIGPDGEHLEFATEIKIPCEPCDREIARQDFSLPVHRAIGAFRLVARRYPKMPGWCCYKGSATVFTMADNIIVSPE